MKLKILILTLLSLVLYHGTNAQWAIKNMNENSSKTGDIKFKNDSLGYFVGGNSYFLKTINSGENWKKHQLDIQINLNDYQFIGDSSIFAVGDDKLIKSKNLGLAWDSITNLPEKQLLCLWFFNTDSGMVAGYDGIYRTVDQSTTWDTVCSITQFGYKYGEVKRLNFPSDKVGYAIGTGRNQDNNPNFDHFLLKSTDSGRTWEKSKSFSPNLTSICFTNELVGFIGTESGIIHKTIDGGDSWDESQINSSGNSIKSIQFISNMKGFATGGVRDYLTSGSGLGFFISQTINGGESWASYDTLGIPLNSIFFINDTTGFVSGDFELIMKSDGTLDKLPENYPWHLAGNPNGIENESSDSQIKIYPNPTDAILYIQNINTNDIIKRISLMNVSGEIMNIKHFELSNGLIKSDFSALKPGLYLLNIESSDKMETMKIIKQ